MTRLRSRALAARSPQLVPAQHHFLEAEAGTRKEVNRINRSERTIMSSVADHLVLKEQEHAF
jgi:hypothetical protein